MLSYQAKYGKVQDPRNFQNQPKGDWQSGDSWVQVPSPPPLLRTANPERGHLFRVLDSFLQSIRRIIGHQLGDWILERANHRSVLALIRASKPPDLSGAPESVTAWGMSRTRLRRLAARAGPCRSADFSWTRTSSPEQHGHRHLQRTEQTGTSRPDVESIHHPSKEYDQARLRQIACSETLAVDFPARRQFH
jgi:hypothetical protein